MLTGITKIGSCYSGVLCPSDAKGHRWKRRIGLITQAALSDLKKNMILQRKITSPQQAADLRDALARQKLGLEVYTGRHHNSFGIFNFNSNPRTWPEDFRQATALLVSSKRGLNRRIFFAIKGVAIEGVENLTPVLFEAMLAILKTDQAPCPISKISITNKGRTNYYEVAPQPDRSFHLTFSLAKLQSEPLAAQLRPEALTL